MSRLIHRGDVYWVDLDKIFPSESHYQKGIRPCIVVSNNYNNLNSSQVIIVPCTTKADDLPQHTYVYMHDIKNYILPEMITTIDVKFLESKYYILNRSQFRFVAKAVLIQLGLYKGGVTY